MLRLVCCCFFLLARVVFCDEKVLVDSSGNLLHPRPSVRPTSASFVHEAGVPPTIASNLSKPPPKPANGNNPFNWFASLFRPGTRNPEDFGEQLDFNYTDGGVDVESNVLALNNGVELLDGANLTALVESEQLIVTPHNLTYGIFGGGAAANGETPPNKGVVDWILGLVGINNNQNNKPQKPEQDPVKMCGFCSCGKTFKHTRIVGGVETQVNAYPWMTILTYNGRFYCGASVINSKYLLTATHCVNGFNKDALGATFLDHDRSTASETKTFTRRITGILKHRGYNQGGTYNNDIALLRLDHELNFHSLIAPVCLPTVGKSYTGYKGVVTGWGATKEHGQVSQKLREVEVPIMSNNDCRSTGYGAKITDNMMCAGFKQGGKDSCQGDSGGPLHVANKTSHTIVGIVSWGEGCAEANFPGVYTRVNRYMTWIKSNTKDACYCS